ncbi:MAG TPA: 2-amino-4-hydroxy-6-hydroxymethyldihydropteridine diphosphokinase [Coleofasciculaceae cyanobacterium]|jgi:2-amino-4-hydroxy-6-hydroxymethyldihydropteridine diphosphokinase
MKAYLALGSNLGDRAANIREAVELLNAEPGIRVAEMSCLYETEPVAMADAQAAWFLNAALSVGTDLEPHELLSVCLAIERGLGRERLGASAPQGYQSRVLDIDILFYGNLIIREERLSIPHPRLHERAFMLVPMLELAPDLLHPVHQKTLQELHLALGTPEEVFLFDVLGTKTDAASVSP